MDELDLDFDRLINVIKEISKEEIIFAFENAECQTDWTAKELIKSLADSFESTFKK